MTSEPEKLLPVIRETGAPCEACGKPMEVGQVVLCYDDAGEMHADCERPFALDYTREDGEPEPVVLLGSPMRHVALSRLSSPVSGTGMVPEGFLAQLRRVNTDRYGAWASEPCMRCDHCGYDQDEARAAGSTTCAPPFSGREHAFNTPHPYLRRSNDAGIMFDALELGGEVGELLNVVKKLEREARGWVGSRASDADFADECADVLICLDKLARRRGVDLEAATIAKFNATSDKNGFPHHLSASPTPPIPMIAEAGEREAQGSFACPICGEEKPHHHTAPVVDAYQTKGSRK